MNDFDQGRVKLMSRAAIALATIQSVEEIIKDIEDQIAIYRKNPTEENLKNIAKAGVVIQMKAVMSGKSPEQLAKEFEGAINVRAAMERPVKDN